MCVCVSAEAADQLGTNGKLVERLVEWCEAKDHAGVMGESNRLLSALIRHSKSKVRVTGLKGVRTLLQSLLWVKYRPNVLKNSHEIENLIQKRHDFKDQSRCFIR